MRNPKKDLNKKGALELSINAVVIIVLALTMLGLGLTFIKSQFEKMMGTSTGVQQQIKEQIESQLRASGEKMSFPREMVISRNKQEGLTLGVQNILNEQLNYKIVLSIDLINTDEPLKCQFLECTTNGVPLQPQAIKQGMIRYPRDCLSLGIAASDVQNVQIKAPSTTGTLALKAEVRQYPATDSTCTTTASTTYSSKLAYLTIG